MARKIRQSSVDYRTAETGAVRKNWRGKIRVALVYPNTYAVGMSNLGFQAVYRLLNNVDRVVCERFFLPDDATKTDGVLRSIESGIPAAEFDIIAISVSFEADYLNLGAVVLQAGLPLRSAARGDPHPLVIAGGVACFLNPEPVAPFIDCFFIGEAELLLPLFFQHYDPTLSRSVLLRHLVDRVPGVYVPARYTPHYHPDGTLRAVTRAQGAPASVQRICEHDAAAVTPAATAVLTPHTTFDSTLLIEVSRGCPHGCRFCSAGFVYRPPRFLAPETVKARLAASRLPTRKVGLVGAAVSDYPALADICQYAAENGLTLSFSSLRANALTPELVALLRHNGVKTATIAPDAGSERMRQVINKSITAAEVLAATAMLVEGGIPNLKLYFMVGLPTETDADIAATIDLCKDVKAKFLDASRSRRRMGMITVSINPFIPKPFTPFQWASMDELAVIKEKIKRIRDGLRGIPNVSVQSESPRRAIFQAVLARGDRRIADVLEAVLLRGKDWKQVLNSTAVDVGFYTARQRDRNELFPWDIIDQGVSKMFLYREYKRALAGKPSPPCPLSDCSVCGVCGAKTPCDS